MAETHDLVAHLRATGQGAFGSALRSAGAEVRTIGNEAARTTTKTGALGKVTSGVLAPFRHLKHEAIGAAKGFAAFGLAFGSVEGIKKSIETTDSLVKTTVKLRTQFGLSTEAASGLAGVLQARDLQPQGLTMGLTALAKQLGQAAHGSKNAQGAFRHFGMDTHDVRKALHGRDGLAGTFSMIVDRLSQMHGGTTKAILSQQLLGRASRGLAPLLQEGALGLKQQLKWAKEFGVTLDEHTVGSVEDMAAAQTKAQYAMLGLQIQFGQFAAPLVAKANLALADIVTSFKTGHATGGRFSKTVYQLGLDLKPLGHDLAVVGRYLKDHPKDLQAAAVAYIAYRTKVLKLITMVPLAFAKGLLTGRAYAAGFTAGAGERDLAGGLAKRAAARGPWRVAGGVVGTAMAAGLAVALGLGIGEWLKKHHVPDWLAKKITGIDPKKTAADERRHSRQLRRDAQGNYTDQTATYGDPATGRVVTVHGRRRVPQINLDDVASGRRRGSVLPPPALHLEVPVKIGERELGRAIAKIGADNLSRGG